MSNHTTSTWAASANNYEVNPKLLDSIIADVVIIGGGFTGLSASYHLGKLGIKSVILEKNMVGWGASGRNGGILLPGYKNSLSSIIRRYGLEKAKKLFEISATGIELVTEIVRKHNIDCSLENSGAYTAAYKPSHLEKLKKQQELLLTKFNYTTKIVNDKDGLSELNTSFYSGGLLDPHGYTFHPLNYALGLKDVVESQDSIIYENTPAISMEKKGKKFIVLTPHGKVITNHLVVATDAYTPEYLKKLNKSIIPISSHMIGTEELPDELVKKLIPKNRGVSDSKKMLYYFRFYKNRFLFGGRVSFGVADQEMIIQKQRDSMIEVFPELAPYKIEHQWGGKIGMTRDLYPQIGQLEDGTHFAVGLCGRGASLSTFLGKLIAENIYDKESGRNLLETIPLKTIPMHNQHAKMVSMMVMFYRLQDYIS